MNKNDKNDKKHNRFVVAFVSLFLLLLVWVWVAFFMVKALPNVQEVREIAVSENAVKSQSVDISAMKGVYNVSKEESSLVWRGKAVVKSHEGTIAIDSGVVSVVDGQVNAAFVIDMTSIETTDLQGPGAKGLNDHLKNEDFFAVEEFPTSEFATTSVVLDGGSAQVTGGLTIKGITNEITFPADFTVSEDDVVTVKGDIVFDRTLWGVEYKSGNFFQGLGDNAIADDIELALALVLQK